MLGFVQKPFFLELEFILSKIFVPLVRDFQMFQKLTNRLPFCFVLRHPHSMRTFATFISVGIARIADRGSWIADRGSWIADRKKANFTNRVKNIVFCPTLYRLD